jgi:hypothetical protein
LVGVWTAKFRLESGDQGVCYFREKRKVGI